MFTNAKYYLLITIVVVTKIIVISYFGFAKYCQNC